MRERTVRAMLVVAIFALLGFALAQSANASPRTCGDVSRLGHTAYTITTNGTCPHARVVVARFITHAHAGLAGTVRHSRLTHVCSWKLRQCRYQGKDRVIRWKWSVPFHVSYASWFSAADEPGLACAAQPGLIVAHKTMPCGTKLEFCVVRCAIAYVGDRGPYIAGREWDFDTGLARATGFGDLGFVRWRIVH